LILYRQFDKQKLKIQPFVKWLFMRESFGFW
jgi:hypothetical protein